MRVVTLPKLLKEDMAPALMVALFFTLALVFRGKEGASQPTSSQVTKLSHVIRPGSAITGLAWSRDGKNLAISHNWDKEVSIYRTADWKLIRRIKRNNAGTFGVLFSQDGRSIYTTSSNDFEPNTAISAISLETGERVAAFSGPYASPEWSRANLPINRMFVMSPTGRYLFAAFGKPSDGAAHVCAYDLMNHGQKNCWPHPLLASVIIPGTSDDILVSADPAGMVRVWTTNTKTVLHKFKASEAGVRALALQDDVLVTLEARHGTRWDDKQKVSVPIESELPLRLWSLPRGRFVRGAVVTPGLLGVAFSRSGRFLVAPSGVQGPSHSYSLYSVSDVYPRSVITSFSTDIWDAQFSRDGRLLGLAGDNEARIYSFDEVG